MRKLLIPERILVHQPDRRPSLNEILTSDWFTRSALAIEKSDDVPKPKSSIFSIFGNKQKDNVTDNKNVNSYVKKNSTKVRNGHRISQFRETSGNEPRLCTTKRNNSVLTENFLNTYGEFINDAKDISAPISGRQITKRLFQSGNLKKKIAPMMTDKQVDSTRNSNEILCGHSTNSLTKDFSIDSKLSVDPSLDSEEQSDFVMLPKNTLHLDGLNRLEIEARKKLEELGITEQMICDAIEAGPRSDIIGAYRIIVHRLQKQESKDCVEENILQPIPRRPRKISKGCNIL